MKTIILLFLFLPIIALAGLRERVDAILHERYENATMTFEKFIIPVEQKKIIQAQSGQKFIKDFVFVWKISRDKEQRLALVDAVRGKSAFITVLITFDTLHSVEQIDILNYKGDRGRGVMNKEWLAQFVGKNADDDFTIGSSIDAVSGASYSAPEIAKGVKRWSLLARYLAETEPDA